MVKKILFVTGTRADFGKLKPLMTMVEGTPGFECHVFATGMHLLSRYGKTYIEILKAGFKNVFPHMNQMAASNGEMDLALANTVQGLAYYMRELRPDLLVIHGDRVEALAGAIVGALNNILVAHIEGGELSGTVDELIRHAVTKLSHLHFVANEEAASRLVQMGEARNSVFVIGSPDVDVMLSDSLPSLAEAKEKYEVPFSEYGIFLYHPVTTALDSLSERVARVVAALRAARLSFLVIYPNNDHGSETILKALLPLADDPRFRVVPSIRFEHFLTLLKHARVIVGNSSAGIREAPVYGVPTLNLGSRQMNRFVHASIKNLPEDAQEILKALEGLPPSFPPSHHFGRGRSAEAFLQALRDPGVWRTPCQKQFLDHAV